MQELKKYLLKLKKEVIVKQKENFDIDKEIKEIILADFQEEKVLTYIKTFYVKKSTLFIETTNKAMAQELFWKSEELMKKINRQKPIITKIKVI